ncbi:MAG TPA: hypothetical protein VKG78_03295 [Opitutaceae bacterium]|nr:hypothetical protein [Opitutaceae bacterium]
MYGVEAQQTGLGGLAAQAPPDVYFPEALGITNTDVQIGSPPGVNEGVPFPGINLQLPGSAMPNQINGSGTAATVPVANQNSHWSSVLDFHNSVAPWILLAILILYGWIHLSVRANAGRNLKASAAL